MRDEGFGLDAITALLLIAVHKRRSLASLTALYRDGWHWLSIARLLKDDTEQVASGGPPATTYTLNVWRPCCSHTSRGRLRQRGRLKSEASRPS